MSAAGTARPLSPFDRIVDRVGAIVPKPAARALAFRIWAATILALYAAFWLRFDSASSAATGIAILAKPERGQSISKAIYRFLGAVGGGRVRILLMALFAEDRMRSSP